MSNHPNQGSAEPTVGPTIRSSSHSGSLPAAPAIFGLAIGLALVAVAAAIGALYISAVFSYPSGALA